ncbi:MAG: hypothetical protein QW197_03115 [Candidatus Aenigmatarchaeota archaeon]
MIKIKEIINKKDEYKKVLINRGLTKLVPNFDYGIKNIMNGKKKVRHYKNSEKN